MNENSKVDELIFPSKRDAWIVGVLWLIILISAGAAIAVFTMSLSLISLLIQEVMWIGIAAFCLSILRSTNYTIKSESLVVRSGPFRWTVQFEDIREVVPSRKAWSSAALSMDRLYINHKGAAGGTYISPDNKQHFLETLAERAPFLTLVGDSLIRVDSA